MEKHSKEKLNKEKFIRTGGSRSWGALSKSKAFRHALLGSFFLFLFSCGFHVTLKDPHYQARGKTIQKSSLAGTIVGHVRSDGTCPSSPSYSLENDYGGLFKLGSEGKVKLAKDNPSEGNYNLVVIGSCESQRKRVSLTVKVHSSQPSIPLSSWLTQLGAKTKAFPEADHSKMELCYGLTVDSQGNSYCAGVTYGALGEANGGGGTSDAFVLKLDPDGNISWLTQLGAETKAFPEADHSKEDACIRVFLDSQGYVYCAGYTYGALGEANGGSADVFVLKLDPDGNISWLTQLGAETKAFPQADHAHYDTCTGIAVDGQGNIYCSGVTYGSLGEANGGSGDAFVLKLDPDGKISWLTQLGAETKAFPGADHSMNDSCNDIALDSQGNSYCGGYTEESLGEANGGSSDAFVLKLDPDGNISWLTQLGADTKAFPGADHSKSDNITTLSIDSHGYTYSSGYTHGALGEANGGSADVFVLKLDPDGNISWLTQLGADTKAFPGADHSKEDVVYGVSVDSQGSSYPVGYTSGSLGEANAGMKDAFILKLDPDGKISWLTQLGAETKAFSEADNSGDDNCFGVSVDSQGNSYCSGMTSGALGETNAGVYDAFILKLKPDGSL